MQEKQNNKLIEKKGDLDVKKVEEIQMPLKKVRDSKKIYSKRIRLQCQNIHNITFKRNHAQL